MKKLALIALMPCVMLISACSTMSDNENYSGWDQNYNFNNQTVSAILTPGLTTNYSTPRQYVVTPQDQQDYDAISNRIQQHQQQVGGNQSSTMSTINTSTTSATMSSSTTNPTMNSAPTIEPESTY